MNENHDPQTGQFTSGGGSGGGSKFNYGPGEITPTRAGGGKVSLAVKKAALFVSDQVSSASARRFANSINSQGGKAVPAPYGGRVYVLKTIPR